MQFSQFDSFFDVFEKNLKHFIQAQVDEKIKVHTKKMDDLVQELQTHRYANFAIHERMANLEKLVYEQDAQIDILDAEKTVLEGQIAEIRRRVGIAPLFPPDVEQQVKNIVHVKKEVKKKEQE